MLMECEALALCRQNTGETLFSKGGPVCKNCHFKYCYVFPSNRCLLNSLIAFQNVLLPPLNVFNGFEIASSPRIRQY